MMSNGRPADPSTLDLLQAALAHRGPDGAGRHLAGPVGLLNTRLAIIDLKTGDQPLYEDLGAALVATILIGWPINLHAYHPGWALLLSYPRLIGGWILFGALLTRWREHPWTAAHGALTNPWKVAELRSKSA